MLKKFELNVRFFGSVQGVGFRSHVAKIAIALHLVGYVKNSPDGSVELCAIGEKNQLDELLQKIGQKNRDNIIDSKISFSEPTRDFPTFEVRL
jgi:acylphosphatase